MKISPFANWDDVRFVGSCLVGFLVFLMVAHIACNSFDQRTRENSSMHRQADKEAWLLECAKHRPLADCRADYVKLKGPR